MTGEALREAFTRAHSFTMLRGFARVGGVLIGNPPDIASAPAINAFTWTEGADGVHLSLKRATDGATLDFGPFRAPILTTALAYSADGRPITATMPLAGVFGRQVMLHPALVDTALGCEARHLDQFADSFTGLTQQRSDIDNRVTAHAFIYAIGWAVQAQRLLPQARPNADEKTAKFMDEIGQMADAILRPEDLARIWEKMQPYAGSWSDGKLSPVTREPAYFEGNLVKDIGQCLGGKPDLNISVLVSSLYQFQRHASTKDAGWHRPRSSGLKQASASGRKRWIRN